MTSPSAAGLEPPALACPRPTATPTRPSALPRSRFGVRATLNQLVWSELHRQQFPGVQYSEPPGDGGLFGPDSAIWYVHNDVSMMVGGVAGLLLGSLHETILRGTLEHTAANCSADRLGRSISFVHAMTYASTTVAYETAAVVQRMHRHVNGTLPDGRTYDASRSEDLIWVGATQAYGTVLAHQALHPRPLTDGGIDEYYAQWAQISRLLGSADPIPASRAEMAEYFAAMRPSLVVSEDARAVLDFFKTPFGANLAVKVATLLIGHAALHVLPEWAHRLYGTGRTGIRPRATRIAATTLLTVLRTALGELPLQAEARQRIDAATSQPDLSACARWTSA
jgi:uncharacterized protein (DUF2236 family)